MTYAGLTISDKPALLDAKARGAEWVPVGYEAKRLTDDDGDHYYYVEKQEE